MKMKRFTLAAALTLAAGSTLLSGPATEAQPVDICNGQWLWQITFDGRPQIEEAIAAFGEDGGLVLYSPSVVPALPGSGDDDELHVSAGVGSWAIAEEADLTCTFSAVRLLADDDGGSIGKVLFQGTVQVVANGAGMEGTFTFDQSSGTGRTVNSGSGAVVGSATGA
ncbi:MAG: hypothetical protein KC442_18900 [Thermomicrobiales bacterium]|nr:hypothetical protein [Thermomicrobiales bacterium]